MEAVHFRRGYVHVFRKYSSQKNKKYFPNLVFQISFSKRKQCVCVIEGE